jgi:hypothetical protein
MPVSDESLVDAVRRDAAELRLITELRVVRAERAAMELEVLNSRDFAVGQAVQIGELRFRLIKQAAVYERHLQQLQSDHFVHDVNHRQHIARLEGALNEAASVAASADRLRREIADLRSSATWRLGRLLLLPVRVAKRLLRRD